MEATRGPFLECALPGPPAAAFVAHDLVALRLVAALQHAGVAVPALEILAQSLDGTGGTGQANERGLQHVRLEPHYEWLDVAGGSVVADAAPRDDSG